MTPNGDNGHLLAAGPATQPPPLPPPPDTPATPADGRSKTSVSPQPAFPCFMCNQSFGSQERFMLVHACRAHAGDIITPSAQARLTASGRGMCSTEHCDALRKLTETYCRKCKLYATVRSFKEGDRVPSFSSRPGLSQAQESQVPRNFFGDDEPPPISDTNVELPDDFSRAHRQAHFTNHAESTRTIPMCSHLLVCRSH